MASYTNQFIGYDATAYKTLESSIVSYRDAITKKIGEFDGVIASLKQHWIGNDADLYTAELKSVVDNAITKTNSLYNGMKDSFAGTYNDWVSKQGY